MDFVNLMSSLSLSENNLSYEKESECILKPISAKINNIQTEIVHGEYTNRIILIITQYEKVGGSMYSVTKEDTALNEPLSEPVYTIKCLFGSDEELHQVAARYFAGKFNITKPLIVFLCLKDYSPDMLKAIYEVVVNSTNSV